MALQLRKSAVKPAAKTAAPKPTVKEIKKTIGDWIDDIQQLQVRKYEIEAMLKAQDEAITAAITYLEANFAAEKINGAQGIHARAERVPQTVFKVKDWDTVYAFILKNKAFELLHKRITDSAAKERMEGGEPVPGLEPVVLYKLKVRPIVKT